jgi:hypothetical protein
MAQSLPLMKTSSAINVCYLSFLGRVPIPKILAMCGAEADPEYMLFPVIPRPHDGFERRDQHLQPLLASTSTRAMETRVMLSELIPRSIVCKRSQTSPWAMVYQ